MSRQKANATFSDRLTRLMGEMGLTLRQLSHATGIHPSTIHSWRVGSSPTNFAAVKRVADALGTTLSYLLVGEHEGHGGAVPSIEDAVIAKKKVFEGYCYVSLSQLIPRDQVNALGGEDAARSLTDDGEPGVPDAKSAEARKGLRR